MDEKPLKKRGGKPSTRPVNQVMKTLLQESHFSLRELAKFAGVSPSTFESYMYFKASPVAKHGKEFWTASAKRIAAAFGLNPEEVFPVETWEEDLNKALEETSFQWRVKVWRRTNTLHVVNQHERSHQLYHLLMTLPKEYRSALMHWAMYRQRNHSWHENLLIKKGLSLLKKRFAVMKGNEKLRQLKV